MKHLQLLFGLLALMTVGAAAQYPATAGSPAPRYRAECQMIIVPQADALAMLPELQDEARIEAAFERLRGLIGLGGADLAAELVIRGNLGVKSVAETIEEFRYGSEFEPPQLPSEVPKENAAEVLKQWPLVGITPTAFETRNVGQTLELEVTREKDRGPLLVSAVAQHVRFLRWVKIDGGRMSNGERLSVEQPIFHSMKTQSQFPVRSGERVLLGFHRVPEAKVPSFEFFLFRVVLEGEGAPAK
jgi:hypothetical protein